MKQNCGTREEILSDIARRQKKLIPLNVVVVILSIVAALTIMFSPLITIDMTKSEEVLSEFLNDSDDGNDEDEYTSIISSLISEITGDEFSLTTYTLLTFSFSDDPVNYITTKIADVLTENTDTIVTTVVIPAIVETVSEATDIEIDTDKVESVLDTFKGLETASTDEEVNEAISDLFTALQDIVEEDVISADIRDEFCKTVRDIYDNTVANTEDGTFSIESFISVYVSEALGNEDEVYTSYSDIINNVLNDNISELSEKLDNYIDIVKIVAIVIACFAGVWGLLFLAAFIRIFTKNKRFTMWYVKLLGFIPCLLFFVVPLAPPSLFASVLGVSATTVSSILSMISTMTWISGICYILLWIVSIFWAFPIKRKIRACKRELRAMR